MNNERAASTIVHHDGFRYRKKSEYRGKINYVCAEVNAPLCPGRAFVQNDHMNLTKNHNHPPFFEGIEAENFRSLLRTQCEETLEPLRTIYDRLTNEHPRAASIVPFITIESSMNRWRHNSRPRVPPTLISYNTIINEERWSRYREYPAGQLSFYSYHIIDGDKTSDVTLIGDREYLSSLDPVTELYVDATFREVPRKPKILQLLTIMGCYYGTPIALAWALMTHKTSITYQAVFHFFKEIFAPHIVPEIVHMDFEVAMKNGLLRVYPNVTLRHCYFHYCQALFRRFKKKKGQAGLDRLAEWDIALAFYRKLLGLALLPHGDIVNAFDRLILTTAPDVLHFFQDLITYFRNWWLRRVTPMRFSMFRIERRTNNVIEAYHRVLHQRIGTHPGIWEFTVKLRNYQALLQTEVTSLRRGLQIRRTRRQEYANHDIILNRMWDLYDNQIIDSSRFLACYNHLSRAFENDIVMNDVAQMDRFLAMPNHNRDIHVMNHDVVIFGIPEDQPTPILRRNATDQDLPIFMVNNLHDSSCPRCLESILNIVCLPCGHWYLCQNCTTLRAQEAFDAGIHVLCLICENRVMVFQTVQIS